MESPEDQNSPEVTFRSTSKPAGMFSRLTSLPAALAALNPASSTPSEMSALANKLRACRLSSSPIASDAKVVTQLAYDSDKEGADENDQGDDRVVVAPSPVTAKGSDGQRPSPRRTPLADIRNADQEKATGGCAAKKLAFETGEESTSALETKCMSLSPNSTVALSERSVSGCSHSSPGPGASSEFKGSVLTGLSPSDIQDSGMSESAVNGNDNDSEDDAGDFHDALSEPSTPSTTCELQVSSPPKAEGDDSRKVAQIGDVVAPISSPNRPVTPPKSAEKHSSGEGDLQLSSPPHTEGNDTCKVAQIGDMLTPISPANRPATPTKSAENHLSGEGDLPVSSPPKAAGDDTRNAAQIRDVVAPISSPNRPVTPPKSAEKHSSGEGDLPLSSPPKTEGDDTCKVAQIGDRLAPISPAKTPATPPKSDEKHSSGEDGFPVSSSPKTEVDDTCKVAQIGDIVAPISAPNVPLTPPKSAEKHSSVEGTSPCVSQSQQVSGPSVSEAMDLVLESPRQCVPAADDGTELVGARPSRDVEKTAGERESSSQELERQVSVLSSPVDGSTWRETVAAMDQIARILQTEDFSDKFITENKASISRALLANTKAIRPSVVSSAFSLLEALVSQGHMCVDDFGEKIFLQALKLSSGTSKTSICAARCAVSMAVACPCEVKPQLGSSEAAELLKVAAAKVANLGPGETEIVQRAQNSLQLLNSMQELESETSRDVSDKISIDADKPLRTPLVLMGLTPTHSPDLAGGSSDLENTSGSRERDVSCDEVKSITMGSSQEGETSSAEATTTEPVSKAEFKPSVGDGGPSGRSEGNSIQSKNESCLGAPLFSAVHKEDGDIDMAGALESNVENHLEKYANDGCLDIVGPLAMCSNSSRALEGAHSSEVETAAALSRGAAGKKINADQNESLTQGEEIAGVHRSVDSPCEVLGKKGIDVDIASVCIDGETAVGTLPDSPGDTEPEETGTGASGEVKIDACFNRTPNPLGMEGVNQQLVGPHEAPPPENQGQSKVEEQVKAAGTEGKGAAVYCKKDNTCNDENTGEIRLAADCPSECSDKHATQNSIPLKSLDNNDWRVETPIASLDCKENTSEVVSEGIAGKKGGDDVDKLPDCAGVEEVSQQSVSSNRPNSLNNQQPSETEVLTKAIEEAEEGAEEGVATSCKNEQTYTEEEVAEFRRVAMRQALEEAAVLQAVERRESDKKLQRSLEEKRELQAALNQFEVTIAEMAERETSYATETVTSLESEKSRLKAELLEVHEAFDKLKVRYGSLKETSAEAELKERRLIEQNKELKKSMVDLQNWSNELRANTEKKLASSFESASKFRTMFLDKEAREAKAVQELDVASTELADREKALAEALSKVSKLEGQINVAEDSRAASERQLESVRQELTSVSDELANRQAEVSSMRLELDSAKQTADKLVAVAEESKAAIEKIPKLEKDNEKFKARAYDDLTKVKSLETELKEKNSEIDDLTQMCEELMAREEARRDK